VEGVRLVLEISDNGPGVSPELLPRIFEPFVTTKSAGSGLGLAICRGIADAHRAVLRADNNPSGRGLDIVLEFAVLESARIEGATAAASASRTLVGS
jgi:signal transduction histidine kinase